VADKNAQDILALKFPYRVMEDIMKPGQIISIISVSRNNEASYKDRYNAFVEYNHMSSLTVNKVMAMYNLSSEQVNAMEELTGNVPLCLTEYIKAQNEKVYVAYQEVAIRSSVNKLLRETKNVVELKQNVVRMMLGFEFLVEPEFYDEKYFVRDDVRYVPLFPLVREYDAYLKNSKAELVSAYHYDVTNGSAIQYVYQLNDSVTM
jgi:hypothetical protein